MARRLPSIVPALVLASALWLGAAANPLAAHADEQVTVRLELSTLAPPSIIDALHASASDDWLASLFPQFAPEDRERIRLMAVERTARGVRIRIDLDEDLRDTARYRLPVEAALEQLAQNLPRPYSYTMKEPPAPQPISRSFPWGWLGAAFAALAVLGAGAWWLARRPRFLSQPYYGGLPMAGVLPAGIGMGGKFLELQSAPCQTMGVMVRELTLAHVAKAPPSEAPSQTKPVLAIASTGDASAAAVVTAALGISLVREGFRVLVVDFMGEDSLLADVLEESEDAPLGPGDMASLRHTGIPDLDLMTAQPWPEGEAPILPRALGHHFDWTVLVLPPDRFMSEIPTFAVFSGSNRPLAPWRMRLEAWKQKASLLGAILVGVPLPPEIRERVLARSYFERIRSLEKVAR